MTTCYLLVVIGRRLLTNLTHKPILTYSYLLSYCFIHYSFANQKQWEYRTYYSGSVDGKRQHGVGIYMHNAVSKGEFDIQPINDQLMWEYGMIYGEKQAVVVVYAPTNKKDNLVEVDKFYSTLEQQIKEVRRKYGPATKIIILGDLNARIGTDGADNMTEECNDNDEAYANGMFGFEETDDNGAELLTFCVAQQFKVILLLRTTRWGVWDMGMQPQ